MLKKNMGSALLELMKEKPLKKITIEELTKKRMLAEQHSSGISKPKRT